MLQATVALFWREVLRFSRQPQRILGAIGAPILFWFILGSGFGSNIQFLGDAQAVVDYRGFFSAWHHAVGSYFYVNFFFNFSHSRSK